MLVDNNGAGGCEIKIFDGTSSSVIEGDLNPPNDYDNISYRRLKLRGQGKTEQEAYLDTNPPI